jgi:hypothetical protein
MKKQYSTILFTLACMFGFALSAHAQLKDTIVASVPYDFVAGNQVLPAGTYTVSRLSVGGGPEQLEITSYDTGASALLIPTFFDDTQTGHPQLSFENAGEKHFLSSIETTIGTYSIKVPREAIRVAQMAHHGPVASGN